MASNPIPIAFTLLLIHSKTVWKTNAMTFPRRYLALTLELVLTLALIAQPTSAGGGNAIRSDSPSSTTNGGTRFSA